MKKFFTILLIGISIPFSVFATNYYVSLDGSHSSPFTNWTMAATTIQDTIDLTINGDIVYVSNGTYSVGSNLSPEPIYVDNIYRRVVITNAINLIGNNPVDTIIAGESETLGVYLGTNAKISNFTIRDCDSGFNGSLGVAIYGANSNSIVSNCYIFNNQESQGDNAINYVLIYNSVISNNTLLGGAAINNSFIFNSLIKDNYSDGNGGVANSIISNSIISYNFSGGLGDGAGIHNSQAFNCLISFNRCSDGGAGCYGSLLNNCTVVSNYCNNLNGLAAGIIGCTSINSIVYYNYSIDELGGSMAHLVSNYDETCIFSNSCSFPEQSGWDSLNITNGPIFKNPDSEDYSLNKTSFWHIDSGTNQTWMVNSLDLNNKQRIYNEIVDMGAYEWLPVNSARYLNNWLTQ